MLLLAVLGPNAETILNSGWDIVLLVAGATLLNLLGYALGATVRPWVRDEADRIAFLFTVSKKEFSIAAVVVVSSGLPAEVAVPAVMTAVIQMITSPLAARWLSSRSTRVMTTASRSHRADDRAVGPGPCSSRALKPTTRAGWAQGGAADCPDHP